MRLMLSIWAFLFVYTLGFASQANRNWKIGQKVKIYKFDINKEIGPAMWRLTQKGFDHAQSFNSDLIIIQMNTYGGAVDAADSIRTKILNSPIPVYIYVNNNAASAGALISIAADRIYMREGASIGAATVVNQTGQAMPDKYQSFMRSMMRATSEAHGKDTIISGKDTIVKWRRDPRMAEAMVDPRTYIPGVNDSGKVLTFTTEEAIKHGFCEGKANSLSELIEKAGISQYELKEMKLTGMDKFISFLLNPIVQGILIMLIVAGLYYEFQSPGIAFPIIIAASAAVLYFAPLYLEGLAQHWEILLFVAGLVLLALEVFVIPGFGITGISGIALVVLGLTLAMADNFSFRTASGEGLLIFSRSLFIVVSSLTISLILSVYLSGKLLKTSRFDKIALKAELNSSNTNIYADTVFEVGTVGVTVTILRPSGKVKIDNEIYNAIAEVGYVDAGAVVEVSRQESGQIYVKKVQNV